MTKKSKKKALKIGTRRFEKGGVTSVPLNFSSEVSNAPANTDTLSSYQVAKSYKKKQKQRGKDKKSESSTAATDEDLGRCVYPFDLWWLIAKYVAPECIGVFAAICRDAYLATCSTQFWVTLYRKHSSDHSCLPKRLLPEFINVKPGLRARVVRALYVTYPVFKERILPSSSVYGQVEELLYQACFLFWYRQTYSVKRGVKLWAYYFKFQRRTGRSSEVNNYVKVNSEQNMCLLQITCSSFMPLPSTTGLVLSTIGISVGRDMKSHQVRMTFHSPKDRNQYCRADGLQILLDPVIDVKVLHWWHPSYPHPLEAL